MNSFSSYKYLGNLWNSFDLFRVIAITNHCLFPEIYLWLQALSVVLLCIMTGRLQGRFPVSSFAVLGSIKIKQRRDVLAGLSGNPTALHVDFIRSD